MKRVALIAALGASCLAVAACGERETNTAEANNMSADTEAAGSEMASDNMMGGEGAASGTNTSGSASAYPKGARMIEENGVTYRVDADGTRVRLGENEGRIITENGVRYRTDSGGNRVRIDERGIDIDLDTPNVKLPDVDAGINEKGNLDIDVNSKKDGNSGPN